MQRLTLAKVNTDLSLSELYIARNLVSSAAHGSPYD